MEELQHGRSLRRYVATAWPEFDWERAYRGFYRDYSRFCVPGQIEPTPALELAARCVVETGTTTLYATLAQLSPEPVLGQLATRIKNDEVRHYGQFYHHFLGRAEAEGIGRSAVIRTLRGRVGEVKREDACYAFKHAFQAGHPERSFTDAEYRAFRRHYAPLARRHYPYRTAVNMFLKSMRIRPSLRRAATPLLTLGARLLFRF